MNPDFGLTHEPLHPFPSHTTIIGTELPMDPRAAVDLPVLIMHGLDSDRQYTVSLPAGRLATISPAEVPPLGDLQDSAHDL